jgi:23S rRNA pseudouridine2605 synthase
MEIRLQKYLAMAGVASRREAEKLILEGKVSVNNVIVTTLGTKVNDDDKVSFEGRPLLIEEHVYYIFHKPINTISTRSDPQGRQTIYEYFTGVDERLFSVGRLDYQTTGLMILTNDGEYADKIMHPSNHIEKTYVATLNRRFDNVAIARINDGVYVDERLVEIDELLFVNEKVLITIHEGRKRIVRRFFKELGYSVVALHREKISALTLGDLLPGEFKRITKEEAYKVIVR